jgi:hypothetical protein
MSDNGFHQQNSIIGDVEVSVQSYRVGSRWAAKVETVDVGNVIGRALADTREQAEEAAMDSAKVVLELRSATASLRASANKLRDKR